MVNQIANRVQAVERFLGRIMFVQARTLMQKGENLIHFELGQPDFNTPDHIREAAKEALDLGFTRYGSAAGIPDLRAAIAEKLREENSFVANPDTEICVTVGSQEAAFLAILCTIEPGDEVLTTDPGYYTYGNCIRMAEAKPVYVPLRKEKGFRIDLEDLENRVTSKSKIIIVNSPCNPTGAVFPKSDLQAIDEIAIKHDLLILSDEIYEKIVYDGQEHHSLAALSKEPRRVITVNGFSKAYAMTGWRIGYVVANDVITSSIVNVQGSIVACATTFVQKGAVAALKGSQEPLQRMLMEFQKRRDIITSSLNAIDGFDVLRPQGAFYAFIDIKDLKKPSMEFCEYLLNEAKVVATPGIAFGQNGEGYIRISYATSTKNVEEGVKRIKQIVEKL